MALAIGASPVMAHAHNEMGEIEAISSALVLNIGTLTHAWVDSMRIAAGEANRRGVPVIFDPVGAGASRLRTDASVEILRHFRVSLLKGNAGEISVLAGLGGEVRGVDSAGGAQTTVAAKRAAEEFRTTVAVTGKMDAVSDGTTTLVVENGSDWLGRITGSGCSATTVIAAFCAVEPHYLTAAASALACYSIAAEMAEEKGVEGPMSFKTAFFDAVYNLTPEEVIKRAKIREA